MFEHLIPRRLFSNLAPWGLVKSAHRAASRVAAIYELASESWGIRELLAFVGQAADRRHAEAADVRAWHQRALELVRAARSHATFEGDPIHRAVADAALCAGMTVEATQAALAGSRPEELCWRANLGAIGSLASLLEDIVESGRSPGVDGSGLVLPGLEEPLSVANVTEETRDALLECFARALVSDTEEVVATEGDDADRPAQSPVQVPDRHRHYEERTLRAETSPPEGPLEFSLFPFPSTDENRVHSVFPLVIVETMDNLLRMLRELSAAGLTWTRGEPRDFGRTALLPTGLRLEASSEAERYSEVDQIIEELRPYVAASRLEEPLFVQALAQHHAVPTRLLDWTEDPLIAIHFLAHAPELEDEPGYVYCLNPARLAELTGLREGSEHADSHLRSLLASSHDMTAARDPMREALASEPALGGLREYLASSSGWLETEPALADGGERIDPAESVARLGLPYPVRIPKSFPRIEAQLGVFTIHAGDEVSGPRPWSLRAVNLWSYGRGFHREMNPRLADLFGATNLLGDLLIAIRVSPECKAECRERLRQLDVFPELEKWLPDTSLIVSDGAEVRMRRSEADSRWLIDARESGP